MKNYVIIALLTLSLNLSATGYKVGDTARDFSLKNVNGKNVALADMKSAKGFIVIFTCNHCPFAKAYESRIMELDKKYASQGYPVIAINPNDSAIAPEDSYEKMVQRAGEMNYSFPYLYDESQEVAAAYGASRTPHVYLLRKEKDKLVVKYIGAIDNNSEEPENADKKYLEDAIRELLSDKPVTLTETKAIGCTIKWKR